MSSTAKGAGVQAEPGALTAHGLNGRPRLTRRRAWVTASRARLSTTEDAWYAVAATVVNVANFAFFGLVGHLLRPSAYGAVATLLNVVSIAAIPLNALQAAVVQETVLQSRDHVVPVVRRAGLGFGAASLVMVLGISLLSPSIAGFFGLSSVTPVLLLAVWFLPAISSSLYDGVLIGTLRWRPIAISLIAGAAIRVVAALAIGVVDPGVDGPIIATVLNAVVTLGVVLYAIRAQQTTPQRRELRLSLRSVIPTVGALTGYSVMVAIDTLLARHTLAPSASGNYAAAVTIGRIALFMPMTVTTIVFPRLVAEGGRGPRAVRMLVLSLGAVLVLGLVSTAVLTVGSHLAVVVLFGHRYRAAASLVGILSAEGALLGGIGLTTYFHIARRSWVAALPALTTVVVAALVLAIRPTAHALAHTMLAAAAVCLTAMVVGAICTPARAIPTA